MKDLWPLRRRKEESDSTHCKTQLVSFHHLIRQFEPGIVKAVGVDSDIGDECVVVEQQCASSVVENVEVVREKLAGNILKPLPVM